MIRRSVRSAPWYAVVVGVAAVDVVLSAAGAAGWIVGVLAFCLAIVVAWRGADWPAGVATAVALVTLLSCVRGLDTAGAVTIWVALIAGVAVVVGVADLSQQRRLVPRVRAVNLPGVPTDDRAHEPSPLAALVPGAAAALAVLLIAEAVASVPSVVGLALLVVLVAGLVACAVRLRSAVRARRDGTANRAVTRALEDYAPQFVVYFSGPVEGDYQVRMWLPYLEQLGARFFVLARNSRMLPRAAALTDAPVVACPRVTGLDGCMVPTVRAVFYVNTHGECADGVRYLDRTHVHLGHGDSDKPSSYHPIFAMFDRVFLAGQGAIDRFARHGVSVPQDRFVLVGRPQVATVTEHNTEPVPGRRSVLYAPTWQSGMREMSLSSLQDGERIVRALLAAGARVIFRPHPLSYGGRQGARTIAHIDTILAAADTPQCRHVGSAAARAESIVDNFNRSDAAVVDISSVASDYLASCKPLGVVLPAGAGDLADAEEYPALRAAYPVRPGGDLARDLQPLFADDPLWGARRDLRTYFLGDHRESVRKFLEAASVAVHG